MSKRKRTVKEETAVQPVIKKVIVAEPTGEGEVAAEPLTAAELKIMTGGEELIAISSREVQTYLQRGRTYFIARLYSKALREFEALIKIAPGNIENRVWMRKAKEKLAEPGIELVAEGEAAPVAEEVNDKECVWMKIGLVSQRLCTLNYDCLNCEFDQMMQAQMASGESSELDKALEKFKELPGDQRLCRYALKGEVTYRLCTYFFQCVTCEFGQTMEDANQLKLVKRVAELAARQDALNQKKQSWWWSYWGETAGRVSNLPRA